MTATTQESTAAPTGQPVLQAVGIVKTYGHVVALDAVERVIQRLVAHTAADQLDRSAIGPVDADHAD